MRHHSRWEWNHRSEEKKKPRVYSGKSREVSKTMNRKTTYTNPQAKSSIIRLQKKRIPPPGLRHVFDRKFQTRRGLKSYYGDATRQRTLTHLQRDLSICRAWRKGYRQADIALMYGISQPRVSVIISNYNNQELKERTRVWMLSLIGEIADAYESLTPYRTKNPHFRGQLAIVEADYILSEQGQGARGRLQALRSLPPPTKQGLEYVRQFNKMRQHLVCWKEGFTTPPTTSRRARNEQCIRATHPTHKPEQPEGERKTAIQHDLWRSTSHA